MGSANMESSSDHGLEVRVVGALHMRGANPDEIVLASGE